MPVEALRRTIESRPEETRRGLSSKPLRLDYIQMGQEVFEFLAQLHGLTLEQALGKKREGIQNAQNKVKEDFLFLNFELLHLTREEVASVFRRTPTVVSYHSRIPKFKADRMLIKPSWT